jgi:Family of unknown function (DUF6228)
MEQVRIGGPGTMLHASCARRLPNGRAELLAITIRDADLEAGRDVYEGYSNGFEPLAAFFEELAESWRGWQGERIYESIEHDLRIVATHDGHVRLKIRLWQSTDPDGWIAETTLRLEAGEQLSQAARDIAAMVRG